MIHANERSVARGGFDLRCHCGSCGGVEEVTAVHSNLRINGNDGLRLLLFLLLLAAEDTFDPAKKTLLALGIAGGWLIVEVAAREYARG